jgi:hypothetical protein
VDISNALENKRENIILLAKGGQDYCELKQRKPWFDKKMSKTIRSKEMSKSESNVNILWEHLSSTPITSIH